MKNASFIQTTTDPTCTSVANVHSDGPSFGCDCVSQAFVSTLLLTACTRGRRDLVGRQRRNVLLLVSDDLRPSLGDYGLTEASTPNIDRLANEGIVFRHAYSQFAYCAPSRNSFMSVGHAWTESRLTFACVHIASESNPLPITCSTGLAGDRMRPRFVVVGVSSCEL